MRRKTAVASFLLLGLTLGAAACGGDEGEPETQAPAEPETSAPTPAEPESGAAPTANTANLPEGVTVEMVESGRELYAGAGICYTCHGPDASGTPLAPDLTDDEWLWIDPAAGDVYEQIVNRVMEGVPEPREHPSPMLPRGGSQLTDEQVREVAAYVYSLNQG